MRLIDSTSNEVLARDVELADTFWRRFRGLMLRCKFPSGTALLFKFNKPGRHSIHMFFVRFPIDLVYLDSDFRVVELCEGLRPWRMYRPKAMANFLIELPAGTIKRTKTSIGHKISPRGKSCELPA